MRISDWSSDVCSSDLDDHGEAQDAEADLAKLTGEALDQLGRGGGLPGLAQQPARERVGRLDGGLVGVDLDRRRILEPGLDLVPVEGDVAADAEAFLDGLLVAPGDVLHRLVANGQDRKSVVSGKGVSGRVDLGGHRNIK